MRCPDGFVYSIVELSFFFVHEAVSLLPLPQHTHGVKLFPHHTHGVKLLKITLKPFYQIFKDWLRCYHNYAVNWRADTLQTSALECGKLSLPMTSTFFFF